MSAPQKTRTFSASTTAAEVVDGVDLHGRRAVVTGASSGIGVETARALAAAGADVTLAVRDTDAGARVAARLEAELSPDSGQLAVRRLDLADRSTVAAFVAAWQGPLHILVGNAGVMALPELTRTPDGRETQFAVNHLGHFALATGLHRALAAAEGARIVSVSSIGHLFSPVVLDDLDYRFRPYDPWTSYGQSKTANILFAVEASKRWASDGITANALMPGGIWTNLQRHWDPQVLRDTKAKVTAAGMTAKTPEQGAATSVLLATWPALDGIGGRYFEDCHEAKVVPEIENGVSGVRSYALDPANARRLWGVSLHLLSAAR
jgi:NAD(P)-dependent dehydrogenase (short-subunit alcohol dehydrogenase family)